MKNLPPDALVASYWTICGGGPGKPSPWTIAQRAEAAAKAGFRGIGLKYEDLELARAAGIGDDDVRRALGDCGIAVAEIEFVSGWSSDVAAVRERARRAEEDLYTLAEVLRTQCNLNVGCSESADQPIPIEAMAERFAALCRRAADHGLTVALEFMPWTGIPDAATGWQVVRQAGQANGGVLLDVWHYFRGAADPEQVRAIPAGRIVGLQINDASPEVVGSLRDDTLHRRKLPGEGCFDLASLVHLLYEMGVAVPYAVEVIADEQFALSLQTAAERSYQTARAVLEKARAPV